jgi:hypothetical protein
MAPSDNVKEHGERLANGGEFLTHLWALLSHAGILDREQRNVSTTQKMHVLILYYPECRNQTALTRFREQSYLKHTKAGLNNKRTASFQRGSAVVKAMG